MLSRMLALPAGEDASGAEAQPETVWTDDGSLPLDSQGQLAFFLLDAHEETATPGTVYLFGKVTMQFAVHGQSPVWVLDYSCASLSELRHKP